MFKKKKTAGVSFDEELGGDEEKIVVMKPAKIERKPLLVKQVL